MKIKTIAITMFFLAIASGAFSESSIIDSVDRSRQSLVDVFARRTDVYKDPKAAAAIDPRTGKILVARRAIAGHHEKQGAGVIISKDGLLVTNLHTVKFADQIAVKLHDGTALNAKVLHVSAEDDLALLKVTPPKELLPIQFADSNLVRLRDEVINIGHSAFLKDTLSGGRVTRLGTRSEGDVTSIELIQVNINLYDGDSGGPLLDSSGRLIGMVVAKLRSQEKASLAIPSNKIKKLYIDYIK